MKQRTDGTRGKIGDTAVWRSVTVRLLLPGYFLRSPALTALLTPVLIIANCRAHRLSYF